MPQKIPRTERGRPPSELGRRERNPEIGEFPRMFFPTEIDIVDPGQPGSRFENAEELNEPRSVSLRDDFNTAVMEISCIARKTSVDGFFLDKVAESDPLNPAGNESMDPRQLGHAEILSQIFHQNPLHPPPVLGNGKTAALLNRTWQRLFSVRIIPASRLHIGEEIPQVTASSLFLMRHSDQLILNFCRLNVEGGLSSRSKGLNRKA